MSDTDIVERLRNRIHDAPMPSEHMMDEAADEIERLRAALQGILENAWEDSAEPWHSVQSKYIEKASEVLRGR